MDAELDDYVRERKVEKVTLNRTEFVKKEEKDTSTSGLLDVKEYQRSVFAVDNSDAHWLAKSVIPSELTIDEINRERVGKLEDLLKIPLKDCRLSINERLKVIEDKLLWIEEHYPQVASVCFDYSKDKKPMKKGRVTNMKQYSHPVDVSADAEVDTGKQILRRMEELRSQLKKN